MFLYLDGCQKRLKYLIVQIIWSFSWLPLINFVNNMLKEYMCIWWPCSYFFTILICINIYSAFLFSFFPLCHFCAALLFVELDIRKRPLPSFAMAVHPHFIIKDESNMNRALLALSIHCSSLSHPLIPPTFLFRLGVNTENHEHTGRHDE